MREPNEHSSDHDVHVEDFVNAGYFIVKPHESGYVGPSSHFADIAPLTYWVNDWVQLARAFGVRPKNLESARAWLTVHQSEVFPWHVASNSALAAEFLAQFCDCPSAVVIGASIHRSIASTVIDEDLDESVDGYNFYQLLPRNQPPSPPVTVLGYDILNVTGDLDHTWHCYALPGETLGPLGVELQPNGLLSPTAQLGPILHVLDQMPDSPPDGRWTPWLITQH
jgi:hypothetical protein